MQYHHHNGQDPLHPAGDSTSEPLRLGFDRRLKLEFHGFRVTCDDGLPAYRELDDALGLTLIVDDELVDPRTGKNGHHSMKGIKNHDGGSVVRIQ